jgi:hypothetical protein
VSLPVQNEMLPLALSIDPGSTTLLPVILFSEPPAPAPLPESEASSPHPATSITLANSPATRRLQLIDDPCLPQGLCDPHTRDVSM